MRTHPPLPAYLTHPPPLLTPPPPINPPPHPLSPCRLTGRRVTFEYTLLAGVNDSPADAEQLAALLARHDLRSHVNVIPWNPVDDSGAPTCGDGGVMGWRWWSALVWPLLLYGLVLGCQVWGLGSTLDKPLD